MSDVVTINEKIALAVRSAHLQHKDTPCPIDKVGALGMAGISNKLSSAVFRLKYGNEARFYGLALAVITEESMRLSNKFGWSGDPDALLPEREQFLRMNKAVLDYWLNDRCMACEGRGYETILGTPVLSNDACGVCQGTSKVPAPKMETKDWDERFMLLLARLEHLERRAGGEVMARLNRQMDEL